MLDRHERGDRALLVEIDFGEGDLAERLDELKALHCRPGRPCEVSPPAKTGSCAFRRRGKVAEIAAALETGPTSYPITLSGHQRNLAGADCRVVDREPILDILRSGRKRGRQASGRARAARTLTAWCGDDPLERQKGGIGLRGPGETQLESDRRLIGLRVKLLKDRLQHVGRQRETQRRARRRAEVRNVALVGYTNAGKSTLFNRLTGAESFAADQLFATLDTTLRRLALPGADTIVVSDTVGFIKDLPHDLVAAFRGTLKEAVDADLLLHVIDASHPDVSGRSTPSTRCSSRSAPMRFRGFSC